MADAKLHLRSVLSDAYSFISSREFNRGINNISLDILIQHEIVKLKEGDKARPSVLERLNSLENRVLDAIEEIKKIDPLDFGSVHEEEQVNTEE